MNQTPKIKITVSFFALIMVLSLVFARAYLSLAALLAAALHELGHIGAARVCRVRFSALKLNIFGASLALFVFSAYLFCRIFIHARA